jgi:hypothetical protein
MFRPSDVRRVQAAFDAALDPPYEAEIQLNEARTAMRAIVMDPDDPALAVVQVVWEFDDDKRRDVKQPSDTELAYHIEAHRQICTEYPARKAAEQAALAAQAEPEAEPEP